MQQLLEDIKNRQFRQVYLLYGQEAISEEPVQGQAERGPCAGRGHHEFYRFQG